MTNKLELDRRLTLPLLLFYGVGTILGAGIYVLIGKVAGSAGLFSPHAFALSALIVSFSAYAYARLSARFPFSAGEAIYIREGLSSQRLATVVGWAIVLTGVVSAATISRGFIGYLELFISLPDAMALTLTALLLGVIACRRVMEAVGIAVIITLIELAGIAMVLWVGAPLLQNPEPVLSVWPEADSMAWQGIFLGAFLAFYAYIGFEDMVNMAEEVREPKHTLPWGIGLALVITTLLYIAVAIVAVKALPLAELEVSKAPFATIIGAHSAIPVSVIGIISLIAVSNGALVQIIMGSRVLYGMARRNMAPDLLGTLHPQWQTPVVATALVSITVLFFAYALPLTSLARLTSAIVLMVFALVNIALFELEWRERTAFSLQLFWRLALPAIGALLCLLFLALQLSNIELN